MKSFVYAVTLSLLLSAALGMTKRGIESFGFRVSGDESLLEKANVTVTSASKADLGFTESTPIGKIFGSPVTSIAPLPVPLVCGGPGPRVGAVLSPITLCFSPANVPGSITIVGPPLTCLCSFRCAAFFLSRSCSYTCGGITLTVAGGPGFRCSVSGTTVPVLPGLGPCPGSKRAVCSA